MEAINTDQDKTWILRPKARILRTMGDELISSEIVAVTELVKNAYDADANTVIVKFGGIVEIDKQSKKPKLKRDKARLEIIDDGNGMSLDTLRTIWMEPATLNKYRNKYSSSGRRVLGEKGIGRFASSRLGNELLVITREIGKDTEAQVIFDWSQFDQEDKYLDEIEVLWSNDAPKEITHGGSIQVLFHEYYPKDMDLTHGTILRIDALRDDWDEEKTGELRVSLARLVSPFFQLQNFQIFIEMPDGLAHLSGPVDPPPLLDHPNYVIRGDVDKFGRYSLDMTILGASKHVSGRFKQITGLNINDTIKDTDPKFELKALETECGPFEIELRIWDRDPNSLQKTAELYGKTTKDIQRDLDATSGISVYRDGFRVLPYGESNDDWLRLDLRRTQNTQRLYNKNILGFVLITAQNNPRLRDQSNREGIVAGLPLMQFRQLVTSVIALIEPERFKVRNPPESRRTQRKGLFQDFNLNTVVDLVASKYSKDSELITLVREKADDLNQRVNAAQEVISRYRRLATLGQLIDTVLHEGRAPLTNIGARADSSLALIHKSEQPDCEPLLKKLEQRIDDIVKQSLVLADVFRRIEPFGGRKRGRPGTIILEDIVTDSFNVFDHELKRENITVILPTTEHKVTVDPSEIQQVLVNLINNSMYWLAENTDDIAKQILVQVNSTSSSDELEIIFSDNGPGIADDDKAFIFDPYFSRRNEGVGLGLTLAGEIVTDYYEGMLDLVDNGPLDGATFRILLRKRV